jgi:hypothetical protein
MTGKPLHNGLQVLCDICSKPLIQGQDLATSRYGGLAHEKCVLEKER